jgi:hypothetical protein
VIIPGRQIAAGQDKAGSPVDVTPKTYTQAGYLAWLQASLSQHGVKGFHSSANNVVRRLPGMGFGDVPGQHPGRRVNHSGGNFGAANINANDQVPH